MGCLSAKCSVARKVRRRGGGVGALGVAMATMVPATGWAQTLEGASLLGDGGSQTNLLWGTAVALFSVALMALASMMAVLLLRRLRWLSSTAEYRLVRSMRVMFGGLVLLAMILPYVVLNFSAATLVPLVAGAGVVIVAGWRRPQAYSDHEIEPTV
jgi:hypothetical protein